MIKAEFIPTPYRRHVTVDLQDDASPESFPPEEELRDAIVRIRLALTTDLDTAALIEWLESIPVHEFTIEREKLGSSMRRETDISSGMHALEALTEWIKQNPDTLPMMEELLAEGREVEEIFAGGEA